MNKSNVQWLNLSLIWNGSRVSRFSQLNLVFYPPCHCNHKPLDWEKFTRQPFWDNQLESTDFNQVTAARTPAKRDRFHLPGQVIPSISSPFRCCSTIRVLSLINSYTNCRDFAANTGRGLHASGRFLVSRRCWVDWVASRWLVCFQSCYIIWPRL